MRCGGPIFWTLDRRIFCIRLRTAIRMRNSAGRRHAGCRTETGAHRAGLSHLDDESMGIAVLDISSEDRRIQRSRSRRLFGRLLGLGIKRDKIGDLHVRDDGCHALIAEEIGDFLVGHLKQAHRLTVDATLLPLRDLRAVRIRAGRDGAFRGFDAAGRHRQRCVPAQPGENLDPIRPDVAGSIGKRKKIRQHSLLGRRCRFPERIRHGSACSRSKACRKAAERECESANLYREGAGF